MLLPALLVIFCAGNIEGDRSHPAQYRYSPGGYKPHLDSNYYKHYQHLHQHNNRRLQRAESSSHLSSPAYRYQPRPVRSGRQPRLQYKYDRKPILIQPSRQKVPRRPLAVPGNNERRTTRKIEQTPLLVRKEGGGGRGKYPSRQAQFLIKNDNLAVESKILETKVRVPTGGRHQLTTSAHKAKPHSVKSSQSSVKPGVGRLPVNRNYNNVPQTPRFIIKQAGPSQQFGWVGHGGHNPPLNIPNIFRAAGLNTRWTPGIDPVFQVGLLYPSSSSQPTGQVAPAAPPPPPPPPGGSYSPAASVKVKKSIPNTEYTLNQPALAPPYTGPAQVSTTSTPTPTTTTTTTTTATTTTTTTTTTRASSTTPTTLYRYSTLVPPYRQSPTPGSYSYHQNSDYVHPSTYKPSFVSSTSKPFSVFIGSSQRPPVSVRTQRPFNNYRGNKDEEVFYIFYENDDKPLEPIKTGVDLQKYIEEEIDQIKKDSFKDIRKTSKSRVRSQKTPVLIDVPIKIEENGEGFTPPSQIRKIFVPRDQSERVPEVFDVSVGTSFGYNKPQHRVTSFPSSLGSSYTNPLTSYEAPLLADRTNIQNTLKKVKRVKKEKLTEEDAALPFGTRLGAKANYDIIKK